MASTSKLDNMLPEMPILANETVKVEKRTHRERRFHRLFRNVPITEILLNRFSCAFVSDIGLLLQGHMYVSNDWICFHSNIFGIEKIIEIPVDSILTVCKARTAKIIPNAVCINTKTGKQYFFGSLLSRDTTHHLLSSVLSRFQQEAHIDNADFLPNSNNNVSNVNSPVSVKNENIRLCRFDGVKCSNIVNGSGSSPSIGPSVAESRKLDPIRDIMVDNSSHSSSSGDSSEDDSGDDTSLDKKEPHSVLAHCSKRKNSGSNKQKIISRSILSRLKYGYHMTLLSFGTWFSNLPKLLMVLLFCVVLLSLLFLFATVLTMRLIYLQNPHATILELVSFDKIGGGKLDLDPEIFDKMNVIVENSVKLVEDVNNL